MLLDAERYASVIEYGKDAVNKINEGNLKEGFESADKGWIAFPESGASGIRAMDMPDLSLIKLLKIMI